MEQLEISQSESSHESTPVPSKKRRKIRPKMKPKKQTKCRSVSSFSKTSSSFADSKPNSQSVSLYSPPVALPVEREQTIERRDDEGEGSSEEDGRYFEIVGVDEQEQKTEDSAVSTDSLPKIDSPNLFESMAIKKGHCSVSQTCTTTPTTNVTSTLITEQRMGTAVIEVCHAVKPEPVVNPITALNSLVQSKGRENETAPSMPSTSGWSSQAVSRPVVHNDFVGASLNGTLNPNVAATTIASMPSSSGPSTALYGRTNCAANGTYSYSKPNLPPNVTVSSPLIYARAAAPVGNFSAAGQSVNAATSMTPPVLSDFAPIACFVRFKHGTTDLRKTPICPYCSFPKSCVEELEAHVAWDHWRWAPFKCGYCPNVLRPTQYTIKCHLQEVHPNQPPTITCTMDDVKSELMCRIIKESLNNLEKAKNAFAAAQLKQSENRPQQQINPCVPTTSSCTSSQGFFQPRGGPADTAQAHLHQVPIATWQPQSGLAAGASGGLAGGPGMGHRQQLPNQLNQNVSGGQSSVEMSTTHSGLPAPPPLMLQSIPRHLVPHGDNLQGCLEKGGR